MIYKYELACREAGLSEEKIAEIRKMYDLEKKHLKREKSCMEKQNVRYFSLDAVRDGDDLEEYSIIDMNNDVENEVIKKINLVKLKKIVQNLSDEERKFLQICYEDAKNSDTRIAKILGVPRQTIQYRKKQLIEKIRKQF